MNAGTRLAAFGLVAALVFGAGFALGGAVGPAPAPAHTDHPATTTTMMHMEPGQ